MRSADYPKRPQPRKREHDVLHHAEEIRERLAKQWGGPGRYFFHRRLTHDLTPDFERAVRERLAQYLWSTR